MADDSSGLPDGIEGKLVTPRLERIQARHIALVFAMPSMVDEARGALLKAYNRDLLKDIFLISSRSIFLEFSRRIDRKPTFFFHEIGAMDVYTCPNGLSSPMKLRFRSILSDGASDGQAQALSRITLNSAPAQQQGSTTAQTGGNGHILYQQRRIRETLPKLGALIAEYQALADEASQDPSRKTHGHDDAEYALKVLNRARWARFSTMPGSNFGSSAGADPEIMLIEPSELAALLRRRQPLPQVVVISRPDDHPIPAHDGDRERLAALVQHLRDCYPVNPVEVQEPRTIMDSESWQIQSMETSVVCERLLSEPATLKERPPLNLLSLRGETMARYQRHIPIELSDRRFALYDTLQMRAEGSLQNKEAGYEGIVVAGKIVQRYLPTDADGCKDFSIFAQRGSISRPHVDIEPDTVVEDCFGEKLWIVLRDLTEAEHEQFAADGNNYIPPDGKPMKILLRRNDVIWMTGANTCIHIPITIEDCAMRGKQMYDRENLLAGLEKQLWVMKHGNVTNEDIPKSHYAMIDALDDWVRVEPNAFIRPADIRNIIREMKDTFSCGCGNRHGKNCQCKKNTMQQKECTPWCNRLR